MPKATSVILGDHFEAFVAERVASGRYGSASEVLRAALRVLEDQEAREQALVQAIIEGENSGDPQPFDRKAHRQNMLDRHASQSE